MKWVLLIAACGSFLIYGHAIKSVFSRAYGVDPRMKALQLAGTVSAVVHLWGIWSSDPGYLQSALAAIVYAIALFIFFAAKAAITGNALTLAFSKDAPQQLHKHGIYARVRHPFYAAYTLTWAAGVIAAPFAGTMLTMALMFALYVFAARTEERKFATSHLAEEYRAYRLSAGMFWPGICRRSGGPAAGLREVNER